MRSWFDVLYVLPWHETVFTALVASVALLALLSIAFAVNVLMLRIVNDRTARRWARLERRWEAPLLGVLSDPETVSELWELVEEHDQPQFVDFVLRWSRRVRGSDEEALRTAALSFLEPVTKTLHSSRVEKRTRGVQTLGTLGLPRYENEVLAALEDESPLVAMVAARSLAKKGVARYAPPILEHLHRFEDWNRNFLAAMLAAMGSNWRPRSGSLPRSDVRSTSM